MAPFWNEEEYRRYCQQVYWHYQCEDTLFNGIHSDIRLTPNQAESAIENLKAHLQPALGPYLKAEEFHEAMKQAEPPQDHFPESFESYLAS